MLKNILPISNPLASNYGFIRRVDLPGKSIRSFIIAIKPGTRLRQTLPAKDSGRSATSAKRQLRGNGYSNTGVTYSPAYLGEDTVNDSIHWDAVREGVEDYETLSMLKDAIATSQNAAWKNRAQTTLDEATNAVTGIWSRANYEKGSKNPQLADVQLQKVRDMLKSAR